MGDQLHNGFPSRILKHSRSSIQGLCGRRCRWHRSTALTPPQAELPGFPCRCLRLVGAPGVAADLSHINTPAKVTGHGMSLTEFKGDGDGNGKVDDQTAFQAAAFDAALQGCDVVVIPAGVPRKPGMTRQDLFEVNASLNKSFAQAVAKNCPKALVAIISNTFVAEAAGIDVNEMSVPVVGGHAGASILPLLSRSTPECKSKLSDEQVAALTHRIQNGGTEVVVAKAGAGSATLSMAKAGADFAISLVRALQGEKGIVQCAYVESEEVEGCQWFATEIELGANGMEKNLGLGEIDEFEKAKLAEAITELIPSITEGVDFVKNN